jgi:hypothetical protein
MVLGLYSCSAGLTLNSGLTTTPRVPGELLKVVVIDQNLIRTPPQALRGAWLVHRLIERVLVDASVECISANIAVIDISRQDEPGSHAMSRRLDVGKCILIDSEDNLSADDRIERRPWNNSETPSDAFVILLVEQVIEIEREAVLHSVGFVDAVED